MLRYRLLQSLSRNCFSSFHQPDRPPENLKNQASGPKT